MTKVSWNDPGTRFYEDGVDRGVLYVQTVSGLTPQHADGVPWNGLVSVSEKVSGGDITTYYWDGQAYYNDAMDEDFSATLEAFMYPDAFAQCDGSVAIVPGFEAMLQPKKLFSLAWRTRVGNDVDADIGYKLHLLYNASAEPSDRVYKTRSRTADPNNFSWGLKAIPIDATIFKPTPYFVIDSRKTSPARMQALEDKLYGTANTAPQMPDTFQLYNLMTS